MGPPLPLRTMRGRLRTSESGLDPATATRLLLHTIRISLTVSLVPGPVPALAAAHETTARSGRIRKIQDSLDPSEWRRVGGMATTVIGLHVLGFVLLFAAISHHYHLSTKDLFGLGTGILAYTLGMRHAFDADHISAIDNTTRKQI